MADALETINFDKISIEVMMIEVQNTFCMTVSQTRDRDRVRAKMTALGYTSVTKVFLFLLLIYLRAFS
jgi:hypothetical protein